jgi:hypothetical protein
MNKILRFPKRAGNLSPRLVDRYYRVYYKYVLDIFKYLEFDIKYVEDSSIDDAKFKIWVDDKELIIDYSDHLRMSVGWKNYPNYFKFHCSEKLHEGHSSIHPFTPISFYDWNQYYMLEKEIKYTCNGNSILNRQRPYGNAVERRVLVHDKLREVYKSEVCIDLVDQIPFWREINNCLVNVCVPGCRNNMLDRGQNQFMAFGCCTISPKIITMLPFNKKLIPGEHYLECQNNYDNLIPLIEWCKDHRKECEAIGQNAKRLWQETSTPESILRWLEQSLDG